MSDSRETFEAPAISDYGDLVDLTAAQGLTGSEDGGSKAFIHHSLPAAP